MDIFLFQKFAYIIWAHYVFIEKQHGRHWMQEFGRKLFRFPSVKSIRYHSISVYIERQQVHSDLILFGKLHAEVVAVGGFDPIETRRIGQWSGLSFLQKCWPFQIEGIETDINIVRIVGQLIRFGRIFQRIIVQPISYANIFEFLQQMEKYHFQFLQTAGWCVSF